MHDVAARGPGSLDFSHQGKKRTEGAPGRAFEFTHERQKSVRVGKLRFAVKPLYSFEGVFFTRFGIFEDSGNFADNEFKNSFSLAKIPTFSAIGSGSVVVGGSTSSGTAGKSEPSTPFKLIPVRVGHATAHYVHSGVEYGVGHAPPIRRSKPYGRIVPAANLALASQNGDGKLSDKGRGSAPDASSWAVSQEMYVSVPASSIAPLRKRGVQLCGLVTCNDAGAAVA